MTTPVYVATLINPSSNERWGKRMYDIYSFSTFASVFPPTPRHRVPAPGLRSQDPEMVKKVGQGYYDSSEIIDIDDENYVRSHTPGGVEEKGTGLGLMLYSGLAMTTSMRLNAPGIFSPQNTSRSSSANAWWTKQLDKSKRSGRDFVMGDETTHSDCTSIEHEISERDIDLESVAIEAGLESDDAGNIFIDDIETPLIQVCWSMDMKIQYLPTENVASSGMVLIWNEVDDELTAHVSSFWTSPSPGVMLNLKLDNVHDPSAIFALVRRLLDSGVDRDRVSEFLLQAEPSVSAEILSHHLEPLLGSGVFERLGSGERMRKNRSYEREWNEFFGPLVHSD